MLTATVVFDFIFHHRVALSILWMVCWCLAFYFLAKRSRNVIYDSLKEKFRVRTSLDAALAVVALPVAVPIAELLLRIVGKLMSFVPLFNNPGEVLEPAVAMLAFGMLIFAVPAGLGIAYGIFSRFVQAGLENSWMRQNDKTPTG